MKKTCCKLIILPHTLTIVFAMFLLLFGFDAFGGSEPIWEQIVGFLIHSVPTYLILAVFFIAKKNVLAGSCVSAGIFVAFTVFFKTYKFGLINFMLISMPMLIISILYLCAYIRNKKYK